MVHPIHVRITAWVLAALIGSPGGARAQDEAAFVHDCGLEPPGAVYAPLPGPRPHETPWRASEPALVRREVPVDVSAQSGLPQTRMRAGALSGRTVYLSPGHGFFRSAPLARWATQRGNTQGIVEDLVSFETLDQYLMPMLLGAGATVVPVRESDLNPRMVLLDNGQGGYTESGPGGLFSTAPSESKGWGRPPVPMGNAVQPFTLGDHRLLTAAPTATAHATWAPAIPGDGAYHVYVSYVSDASRVTDAHYVVRHAGGESHFRVNQRRHGGTWVFLGRFYFREGAHPETASVVALNDSAEAGSLSLDAIRIGGGSGDVGDAVLGPLPRSRSEECARYHAQFSGAPPEVFAPSRTNALSNERNDDVSARPRFAAWLHEEGEDAVYVAWHTNASSNGSVRGTEAYVYGPNPVDGTLHFTGVKDSDVLARALLDELSLDLKREVDPTWRVRSLRSANLGEVNPTHNPEFPSVLLEIAYHDNAQDAAWLKEPFFRRVASRAILHGLIKYFAARDGVAVQLPPEPPVAVVARNAGGGAVEVKWTAPVDPDGSVPPAHPATGYRVYQSADGLAWDEGTETASHAFTTALSAGTTRYFRVAALNPGGESFPSDVVGVRVPSAAQRVEVLVVNAFRRLDASMTRTEDLSAYALEAPVRQFLESMNDGTALRRHGDAVAQLSVAFDGATQEALAAGLLTPVGYRVLDWFTGRGGVGGAGPSAADQALMRTFVSAGGSLLLSGSRIASALAAGGPEDQAFLSEFLHATPGCGLPGLQVQGLSTEGAPGLPVSVLENGLRSAFPVGSPEVLFPLAGGLPVLGYAGTDAVAAVHSSSGGQVLLLGVPLEGFATASRRAFLLGSFLTRAGVVTSPLTPPEGDEGPPSLADLATLAEAPLCSLERASGTYENPERGCGCQAGDGTGPLAALLLAYTVQRRRTRRSSCTER